MDSGFFMVSSLLGEDTAELGHNFELLHAWPTGDMVEKVFSSR